MANNTGQKFGGRTKGVPNKESKSIRDAFQLLVENNLTQLEQDLKVLDAKDRVKAILDLSKFVIPLLKATELNDVSEHLELLPITFRIVDPNEVKEIIKEIEQN